MKQDSELSTKYCDQATLLKGIIENLEARKIYWPNRFSLMSSEEWIQKMKLDPTFYWCHAKDLSEIQKYEDLLLDLAAQCLKKKINLIPLLEEDEASIFTEIGANLTSIYRSLDLNNQPQFHLLSCQKLKHLNFFASVFKNEHLNFQTLENITKCSFMLLKVGLGENQFFNCSISQRIENQMKEKF